VSLLPSLGLRTVGLLCLSAPLFAQSPGSSRAYSDDITPLHAIVEVERNASRPQVDRKAQAAQKRQLEFAQRVVEFTDTWNSLIQKCGKGTWSPKQAKAVRKAFERLLRTEGWMEERD
jgi:hypothetical protein